jgi:hypothetical protein
MGRQSVIYNGNPSIDDKNSGGNGDIEIISSAENFVPENRGNKNEKLVAGTVICLLLAISALCAGLPSTRPYGVIDLDDQAPDDVVAMFIPDSGDTAWVIVASALGSPLMRCRLSRFYFRHITQFIHL